MSGTPASAQQAMSGECGPAQADAQMGFAAKPRRERNKTKAERSGSISCAEMRRPARKRKKKKRRVWQDDLFAAMNPGRLPEQRLGINNIRSISKRNATHNGRILRAGYQHSGTWLQISSKAAYRYHVGSELPFFRYCLTFQVPAAHGWR